MRASGTEAPGTAGGDLTEGEVTFVFTDIVGSTGLLRSLGDDGYPALLAQYIRLMVMNGGSRGGRLMSTEGDHALHLMRSCDSRWPVDGGPPRISACDHLCFRRTDDCDSPWPMLTLPGCGRARRADET